MTTITKAGVENATLDWLAALGWQLAYGPTVTPGTPNAGRVDCGPSGAGAKPAGRLGRTRHRIASIDAESVSAKWEAVMATKRAFISFDYDKR